MKTTHEKQVEFVLAVSRSVVAICRRVERTKPNDRWALHVVRHEKDFPEAAQIVATALLKQIAQWSWSDLSKLIQLTADRKAVDHYSAPFIDRLINDLARRKAHGPLPALLKQPLKNLADAMRFISNAAYRKRLRQIEDLIERPMQLPLVGGDAWADQACRDVESAEKKKSAWHRLLAICDTATGPSPSAKWSAAAVALIEQIGAAEFSGRVGEWVPLLDKPRIRPVSTDWRWENNAQWYIHENNARVLKGLVWCCGASGLETAVRPLAALALSAYRKLPGIGPRLVSLGNACIWALGSMPGLDGVYQLAILKTRVKFGTAQKLIEKAFTTAAEKAGLPRDDIEEMAVPTYGLESVGRRCDKFGDYTATLGVGERDAVEIRWSKPDGKPLKSPPAAVKTDHAEGFKELSQAAKDLTRMLPAQRERIDTLHLAQKSWPLETWRQRYLDHPLVGTIARRLIWTFTSGNSTTAGFYRDGAIVDFAENSIDWLATSASTGKGRPPGDGTTVKLWHPIGHPLDRILAWRRFLEENQIRQPFKQAHREVYLLTDAERNTRTYSNRFAAHFLRQHQFNALCAVRGWKNKLRLLVDAEYPPATLNLPRWNLRAEFWIEGVGDDYGTDTNETGVYHRISTDQVRFYTLDATQMTAHAGGGGYGPGHRKQAPEPLPLDEIPPLVFSEVMRDVDLFVGVTSVANDPAWSDGGPDGRFRDYWTGVSFGDLDEIAKTRKAVLERLIPRLAIADRCSFNDKFLVVRGDLRTYKIHLGSTNILMEPNSQYLCIVPSRGTAVVKNERVFLPFEGDNQLSVILSKALMLADDRSIRDSSIVNQIKMH
jgi:Domain of unknown function (DUF4132)